MTDLAELSVVARGPCTDCDGTGAKISEDWEAFQEWRSRRPTVSPEAEDDLVEQYFLVVCDFSAVPPMRADCDTCDGSGKVMVEVAVRELLELVFEHVDRPLMSEGELDEAVSVVKKAITSAAFASQGLADGMAAGSWLRAVQEGAEALRSLGELRARRRDF